MRAKLLTGTHKMWVVNGVFDIYCPKMTEDKAFTTPKMVEPKCSKGIVLADTTKAKNPLLF